MRAPAEERSYVAGRAHSQRTLSAKRHSALAEQCEGGVVATVAFTLVQRDGAILAVAWAYAARLADVDLGWVSGLAAGAVLWALALLMMSTIGSVHPPAAEDSRTTPAWPPPTSAP